MYLYLCLYCTYIIYIFISTENFLCIAHIDEYHFIVGFYNGDSSSCFSSTSIESESSSDSGWVNDYRSSGSIGSCNCSSRISGIGHVGGHGSSGGGGHICDIGNRDSSSGGDGSSGGDVSGDCGGGDGGGASCGGSSVPLLSVAVRVK